MTDPLTLDLPQLAVYIVSGLILAHLNDIARTNRKIWAEIATQTARHAALAQQVKDIEKVCMVRHKGD